MTRSDYIAKRAALAEQSAAYADEQCGKEPPPLVSREKWSTTWDAIYWRRQGELCRLHGLEVATC